MTTDEIKGQILAKWDYINQEAKKRGYTNWYVVYGDKGEQFWLQVDVKAVFTQKEYEAVVDKPSNQLLVLGSGFIGGLSWNSRNQTLKWVGVGGSALASYALANAEKALDGPDIIQTLAVSGAGALIGYIVSSVWKKAK